jgi:hypothetical protein
MTRDEARDLFSAAWDGELGAARGEFDALLAADPELRAEYEDFTRVLRETQALMGDAGPLESEAAPTPDVLAGVQRKLRARSGGRFYRDRFSERATRGVSWPLLLAGAMLVLLAVTYLVIAWTSVVDTQPHARNREASPADATPAR